MDDSLAEWLRIREAADAAARQAAVEAPVLDALAGRAPVRVLDLATGAGSNLRHLADRLPPRQQWLVVDHSDALLRHLVIRTAVWAVGRGHEVETADDGLSIRGAGLACDVTTRRMDLGTLDTDAIFEGRDLVTASALLDLVSDAWLQRLADQCRRAGAHALFTITYDGRSGCLPAEPEDEMVRELFNAHQARDKGLGGGAAGPGAASAAERAFASAGFAVHTATSDWRLGEADAAVQRVLITGWADASSEVAPDRAAAIADWRARRLAHVDAGRSRLVVGHVDLAALHPGR
ncbi:MAG: class I SAM-dependent methyltransferase [Vicinamibacterales bacterium]